MRWLRHLHAPHQHYPALGLVPYYACAPLGTHLIASALSGTLRLWAAQMNTPQRSLWPSSSVFYFLFYFILFYNFLRSALILEVIKPLTTYLKKHNILVEVWEAQVTKYTLAHLVESVYWLRRSKLRGFISKNTLKYVKMVVYVTLKA